MHNADITLILCTAEGANLYLYRFASPLADDSSWDIVVNTSAAVWQIMRRRWGPRKSDIVFELVKRGIPFRIARIGQGSMTAMVRDEVRYGVGLVEHQHRFSHDDYEHYENIRDALFQERGAAVLCQGGIVWRLAVMAFNLEDVLLVPANFGEHGWRARLPDGTEIVSADLSGNDLDIIVGMYRRLGGMCIGCQLSRTLADIPLSADPRYDAQVAYVSWWPRQHIWMSSTYNVGFWTTRQEDWFQNRLAEIRARRAEPISSYDWQKKHFLGDKRALTAVKRFEDLCTQSLARTH